ncbi:hypothetical protein [uncultured Jatrophihabitans sp.]|uniref:hypothetical protein n=1 Tax=uncultured Jatrophihabitans sp. TaxID=1610747 RepID=UPI0035CB5A0D
MADDRIKVRGPEVLAFAERFDVDLTVVQASAGDGRISKNDAFRQALLDRTGLPQSATNQEIIDTMGVIADYAKWRKTYGAQADASARARSQARNPAPAPTPAPPAPSYTSLAARVAGKGAAFALNPAVDRVRAEATTQMPAPTAPAPTLFVAGDLPSFTASGVPPETLLEAPWGARHAMAAAPTQAAAYEIQADCAANDNSPLEYDMHPGNAAYQQRVAQWQRDSITDEQIEAMFARDPLGAKTIAAEKAAGTYEYDQ